MNMKHGLAKIAEALYDFSKDDTLIRKPGLTGIKINNSRVKRKIKEDAKVLHRATKKGLANAAVDSGQKSAGMGSFRRGLSNLLSGGSNFLRKAL